MDDLPDVPIPSSSDDIEQVEGLSAYDMVRKPRQLITDPDFVQLVEVKRIMQEFKCPICLGVLNNTVTVMQCLHRFCSSCMERNLRSMSKKQCPACRIHVPSRRSLQRDFRIDTLISKIIPDVSRFERKRLKRMAKVTANRTQTTTVNQTWSLIMQQQNNLRKKTGQRSSSTPSTPTTPTSRNRKRAGAPAGGASKQKKSVSSGPARVPHKVPPSYVNVVLAKHPKSTVTSFEPTPIMVGPNCTISVRLFACCSFVEFLFVCTR